MSFDKMAQLAGSLAQNVQDNERLPTALLNVKLARALQSYPSDQTLGAMSRVIGQMSSNNTSFIRRADLKKLYTKLHSRNTKFAQLFAEELGAMPELQGAKIMPRDDNASEINPYQVGDQILANALNSVFDKNLPLKMYSQPLADQAKTSVARTLNSWNLTPSKLEVAEGNDKFLVIRADYETPKGVSSVYVPIELVGKKVVDAAVFMGNLGPQELNHSTLKSYITAQAGVKSKITASAILNVLTVSATEKREISDAEMALIKLNASRQEQVGLNSTPILGQKFAAAARADVVVSKSAEADTFEAKFASPRGQAEFKFGAEVVKVAREHLTRELTGFGYTNSQIAIAKFDDTTLFYSVALDGGRVGFTVPVKVAGGKISKPTVMLCAGSVSSFSKEGINQLYVSNQSDYKAAAVASPSYNLKPADLVNNIRQALADDNLAAAEDALNVLSMTGNKQAYASAFDLFVNGLSFKKEASGRCNCENSDCKHEAAGCKNKAGDKKALYVGALCDGCAEKMPAKYMKKGACSMLLKNATSQHPICGHTGLPAHKVYQDKDGNCRPMYRQGQDDTYEVGTFNSTSILG